MAFVKTTKFIGLIFAINVPGENWDQLNDDIKFVKAVPLVQRHISLFPVFYLFIFWKAGLNKL